MRFFKNLLKRYVTATKDETSLLALGAMLSKQQTLLQSNDLNDYEFKIFSQWGDDGIIQYLIKNIYIENEIFIEFGVEDFQESNGRFLMMNNNWKGFVMDGSEENLKRLRKQRWYWKYALTEKAVFIDRENINRLLNETGFSNIGILSIDIDGNDAFIFDTIDLSILNPSIIITEYNAVFGKERLISVPYDKNFVRHKKHFTNLYYGASLPALTHIAHKKGYALVGCNRAGNNAYYVRRDLLNEKTKEKTVEEAYKASRFREGRNEDYSLSLLDFTQRYEAIKGLDVLNIENNKMEKL